MILVVLLIVPTLLATWFAYWFIGSFTSSANRFSKILGLTCPTFLAILALICFALGAFGVDIDWISELNRRQVEALILAIAILQTAITLLLASLAGKQDGHAIMKGKQ